MFCLCSGFGFWFVCFSIGKVHDTANCFEQKFGLDQRFAVCGGFLLLLRFGVRVNAAWLRFFCFNFNAGL